MKKKLFNNPKVGDKVILNRNGKEEIRRIEKVGKKSIVVTSINLFRFNRDGSVNRSIHGVATFNYDIKPYCEDL